MSATRNREKEEKELRDGYLLIYSGIEEGRRMHGVGIIMGPRMSPYIEKVKLVSERLMKCILDFKNKISLLSNIHTTARQIRGEEDGVYGGVRGKLQRGQDDVRIMMGDFNARVGRERTGIESAIGPVRD